MDQLEYDICSRWRGRQRELHWPVATVCKSLTVTHHTHAPVTSVLHPQSMAERPRDSGVEQCKVKSFSTPSVYYKRCVSATDSRLDGCDHSGHPFGYAKCNLPPARLPLGALVPNTPTATPTRRTRTEAHKSADTVRRTARFTRKTEGRACTRLTKDVRGGTHFCNTRTPLVLQENTRFRI